MNVNIESTYNGQYLKLRMGTSVIFPNTIYDKRKLEKQFNLYPIICRNGNGLICICRLLTYLKIDKYPAINRSACFTIINTHD